MTSALAHDGRTTRRMARYRGMPRARAASLAEVGTSRMASSEVRATIGIMIVASAMTAEITLKTSGGGKKPRRESSKMNE